MTLEQIIAAHPIGVMHEGTNIEMFYCKGLTCHVSGGSRLDHGAHVATEIRKSHAVVALPEKSLRGLKLSVDLDATPSKDVRNLAALMLAVARDREATS